MVAGRRRRMLEAIYGSAIAAVDPAARVADHLDRDAVLGAGGRPIARLGRGRLRLVAAGKAAAPMTEAALSRLGDRIDCGVVAAPGAVRHSLSSRIEVHPAEHPLPGPGSLAAGRAALSAVAGLGRDDVVLLLLSGGASSLIEVPAPGLRLRDLVTTVRLLLRAGASIGELNAVRKHLSRIKGGGLARVASPARVVALLVSDVIGSSPAVIGSGPAAADPTTFADARRVLERRGLGERVPARVRRRLEQGMRGACAETAPARELRSRHVIVADVRRALEGAAAEARRRGYRPVVVTSRLRGEARLAAGKVAAAIPARLRERVCLLFGGETTVRVTGDGLGGRNQELALALALALQGRTGVTALAAGTDGIDGPTDAAGAFAGERTLALARRRGLDPSDFLERNDAYRFFAATGDLFRPGPTGTNVMDLTILLVDGSADGRGRT